jgi:hypothetical protein
MGRDGGSRSELAAAELITRRDIGWSQVRARLEEDVREVK